MVTSTSQWINLPDSYSNAVSRIEISGDCRITVANSRSGAEVISTYQGPGEWDYPAGTLVTGNNNIESIYLWLSSERKWFLKSCDFVAKIYISVASDYISIETFSGVFNSLKRVNFA